MFRDVPACSGVFRNVPCSGFYRRPFHGPSPHKLFAAKYCFLIPEDDTSFFFFISFSFGFLLFYVIINFYKNYFIIIIILFIFMKIVFIFSCSGMFRNVPECSGMFRNVPYSGIYRRPHRKRDWVICIKLILPMKCIKQLKDLLKRRKTNLQK